MIDWDALPQAKPKKKIREDLNRRARLCFTRIGWEVGTTQWYNAHANRSNDLFGFADLLMFLPPAPDVVLVQVTDKGDKQRRIDKILANAYAYKWTLSPHHHIWVNYWWRSKDTPGGWAHDVHIMCAKDFVDACLINCDQLAELNHADLELMSAPPIVPNIVGSTNISLETKRATLHLIKPSTPRPHGGS